MNANCFHCGLPVAEADLAPVRYPIRYRNVEHAACCTGCQAVADTIIHSGLDSYYDQRDRPADRAEPLPSELAEQLKLYDLPEVQQSFVRSGEGSIREAALLLEGISCSACIWLNERHLQRLPGVIEASVNYTTRRARVIWDDSRIHLSDLLEAVAAIGYRAHPYDPGRQQALHEKERKQALNRLWIAGLSMMQVMMYAVPVYMADPGTVTAEMERLMQYASLVLTLPVLLYSCLPFYRGVWRDLQRGRVGMDLPVTLGVVTAFAGSVHATWVGHGEVYYDSVSMFVFLLLGGRYLEAAARRKTGAAAESLVKLIPAFAHHLPAYPAGREPHAVAVARLAVGDTVLVKPGESYPADGRVLEGAGHANESLLTGESRPISKQPGDPVVGGAINVDAPLVVRIERIGESTQLAGIVRLLDKALADKPRLAQLADQVAGWFVAALLLTAAAAWWYWQGRDPAHALPITVAVLVISCPCALSLATPAALATATGRLARAGLLITRGRALETLARADTVIFDKTGTLTLGRPVLVDTLPLALDAHHAHRLAAALETASEHPLAQALRDGVDNAPAAQNFSNYPGGGVEAEVAGVRCRIGHPAFVATFCQEPAPATLTGWRNGHTVVALADGSRWLAAFALGDAIRPEAAATVAALRAAGCEVHILSGDAPSACQAVATTLGIEQVRAQATPADKLAYVQALQAQGRRVAMVGDGVNDAPVLAAADVSIAVGGGAEAAQSAGDAVLVGSLTAVAEGLITARRSQGVVVQNLIWALGYNLIALPFAWLGLVTPWLASLGMALSSLLVVGNALRLAGGKPVIATNDTGQK
ncbi:heavy metal translocating P-type ATPase [Chitinimonas lacunae]|uniref:Heavy metal translocating P-type ATPase n=1 Tax=Chitinimonas lacunae TaxID=1963018 RepID=A0ABV8MWM2_9NEIS